jgi:hypothetical protein
MKIELIIHTNEVAFELSNCYYNLKKEHELAIIYMSNYNSDEHELVFK